MTTAALLDRILRPRYVLTAFAVVTVLAALLTRVAASGPGLTTFSTAPGGAAALRELLQRLGWPTERRLTPLRRKLDSTAIYAVLEPPIELTTLEVASLLAAVRRGARALVVPHRGTPLADSLRLRPLTAGPAAFPVLADSAGLATPATRSELPELAAALRATAPLPSGTDTLLTVHTPAGPRPAALGIPLGRGRLVALADARVLRNDELREGEPAVFAVRLLEWLAPVRRATVVFSEYHQGYGRQPDLLGTTAGALRDTAPGRALLVAALAALVLLAAIAVRPIAPRAPERIERRSALEHVWALARAYQDIGATRLAARRLVHGLRRRHPLAASDDAAYLSALAARYPAAASAADLLRSALHHPVSPGEATRLARAAATLEHAVTQ